jgi:DMSO/TMAO reductase YedYZ heme-binding membrane subunit
MPRPDAAPAGDHRRAWPVAVVLLLVAVLAGARTRAGASAVLRAQDFLEFFSGVFSLVALTAAVTAGVGAAQRLVPIRFRILFQAAHRAMAVLAVGFLVTHVLLKVMEAHAGVLESVVPFVGGPGRLYVGLGTIAGDLLILALVTGVLRGRFVARSRPWLWRAVHSTAYLMWPLAMVHGLSAGRPPKSWVTWSYVICFGIVMAAAVSRLPRMLRDRRMLDSRAHAPAQAATGPRDRAETDVPDEHFWASLRAETGNGGRR